MDSSYTWIILIFILLFSYFISEKFRYYSKFGIYIVICIVTSIILFPVAILRPKNVDNLFFLSYLCRIISPLIGIEWIIEGKEYLSKNESYIVMANHQSSLDVVGMFHLWPILRRGTAVAKEELRYAWPFGLFLWLAGVVFIPRSKGEVSRQILNKELQKRKKEKVKLWIFPEGTRRSDGKIHNFKKGGFHMALSEQIPILPVVFSYYYFLDHEKKHFHNGKVVITVLPPVYTEGKSLKSIDDLVAEVREKMIKCFDESCPEEINA
ncbi:1-acyl-sn-glycerol-3-phosphate acyltransferase alpha-like [Coccinella septempunctata]|uniref:1-acyl-sn-glycerol-3-phosphate acyltransferase alpha-like n=1 Tax=Coccinella septempunctata TaxID=41139 RepID=UPI001D0854D5|nr:1-acyl-sn-glycerol-3-phosphate acyltransferase alpha-like [Coccinella septempunctata]